MSGSFASRSVRRADVSGAAPSVPADPGVRGLQRGLDVLAAMQASGRDGMRIIDICRHCGLERATVYRLLATLMRAGYVEARGRFRYGCGPRVAAAPDDPPASAIAVRADPVLTRVSAACGDAAYLSVRDRDLSHCIARKVGSYPVQILSVQVDSRQPLGVGAGGLALLASIEPAEASRVIAANATQLGRYNGMTPARMELLVRSSRERGYSVVGNHAVKGALGVGMTVVGGERPALAAISVAAPIGRMPKERQRVIAAIIRDALAELLPNGL
ncbi:IclR family transcriptional regulator C-terminal domain-containing protein [soil metagenome]